eukprot:4377436-Alexandrium_andersonii.AAC.1
MLCVHLEHRTFGQDLRRCTPSFGDQTHSGRGACVSECVRPFLFMNKFAVLLPFAQHGTPFKARVGASVRFSRAGLCHRPCRRWRAGAWKDVDGLGRHSFGALVGFSPRLPCMGGWLAGKCRAIRLHLLS